MPTRRFPPPCLPLSVIYLNRRGRFFLRRDGCRYKFRQFLARRDGCGRSAARQWWRMGDPTVVSASSDVISICGICADVVSICANVFIIGDDVLSIGDDVIHPIGNIMRKHRQA